MHELIAGRTARGIAAIRGLSLIDLATFGVRQRRRAAARKLAFAGVNAKYGPEPRENRRRMALRIATRSLRDAFGK